MEHENHRRYALAVVLTGLYYCDFSFKGCAALSSALRSNPSHLRKLNISQNNIRDSGVKSLSGDTGNNIGDSGKNQLFSLKDDERYKLLELKLYNCNFSDEGCAALSLGLRSNLSHLRELNLFGNYLGDSKKNLLVSLKDDERNNLLKLM
ncbi:Ribonuclease inhibitor [Bagarius yarrelli]|uniref:Ribonuclease inhibitor n=1 Tax=Bagarius yarrelli TaxID=175774 RepID=A0A556VBI0_BAGYA|nr:Ribonuclease inhibitor [Bagarius yarrelli]